MTSTKYVGKKKALSQDGITLSFVWCNTVFIFASNNDVLRSFFLNTKGLGKGAKKQVVTDEWRNGNTEERLEYALVKVTPPPFIIYHYIDNLPFCNLRSLVIRHL